MQVLRKTGSYKGSNSGNIKRIDHDNSGNIKRIDTKILDLATTIGQGY